MTVERIDPFLDCSEAFSREPWRSKVAMEGPGFQVTFDQLGTDVATMRDILRRGGVNRVAISLPYGVAQVVAVCGAIAARAVYVPIDETQSMDRNGWILQEACAQAMLCHADSPLVDHPALQFDKLVTVLPLHGIVMVKWTREAPTTSDLLHDPDAMYVLFTSGSTGVPKGVVGSRRATRNRLQWMWEAFRFHPHEKVLRSTKLTFVDAVWEILGTLWSGHTLVVVPHTRATPPLVADLARTLAIICSFRVTRLTVVPSVLQMVLNASEEFPPSIQMVIVSGETLHPDLLERAMQAASTATFLNLYGSTEVSGDVTSAAFSLASTTPDQVQMWRRFGVPIGKPIHRAKAKLVPADDGESAPSRGELWVAGEPLAVGYLNGSDTRAKFVQDGSDRWFKTGDECCRRGDVLFYCGRMDSQAKIGGIAVHLDAVEASFSSYMARHFGALQWYVGAIAASTARQWLQCDTLVVFVGIRGGAGVLTPFHARRAVDEFFHVAVATRVIPIELADFPLTASGKICRRQLSARFKQAGPTTKTRSTGHDLVESILSAHLDQLPPPSELDTATLAAIGVNSLVATMVLHDLRTQCGLDLDLVDVAGKTMGQLRAMVEECGRSKKRSAVSSPPPTDTADTAPKRSKVEPTRWDISWSIQVKKCIDATPLVLESPQRTTIVVGSHDHHVTCVDAAAPHAIMWRTELPDRIESSCVALEQRVFVGCYDGCIYCVRSTDGEVLWSFATMDQVKCTPLVVADKKLVVCGSHDHHVYGLDAESGACQFKLPFQKGIFSTPAVANDMVFCASIGGELRGYEWKALETKTTEEERVPTWTRQLGAPVFGNLVTSGADLLLVACADGCLYGMTASTGTTVWTIPTSKPIFCTPCVIPLSIPPRAVFGSHDGILRCADLTTGEIVASVDLGGAIFAAPTVLSSTGDCGACTTNGIFYVWDTTSPTWQSKVALGGNVFSSPVAHGDAVYVGTRANDLLCLRNR